MEILRIKKLFVENFKSYQDKLHVIEFGEKITLIFGKNSAGKSSLVQALKLIQQSKKYKQGLLLRVPESDSSGMKFTNFASLLPNFDQKKKLSLGIECESKTLEKGEVTDNVIRGITKTYKELENNLIIPDTVNLYSPSDKKKNGEPNNERFLSVENKVINFDDTKAANNLLESRITFIGNEGAYYELYELFKKNRLELISRFKEVMDFIKSFASLYKEIDTIQKKKDKTKEDKENIEKINSKIDSLFDFKKGKQFEAFRFMFPDVKVSKHAEFIANKNISLEKFVDYINKDEIEEKKFVYNNDNLFWTRRHVDELASTNNFNKSDREKLETICRGGRATIKEFLCYVLSWPYTKFPTLDTIFWSEKESPKSLAADKMFDACNRVVTDTLSKTRIFYGKNSVPERSTGALDDKFIGYQNENLHEVLKNNIISVNKYLDRFGFDFKAKIRETNDGETLLGFSKSGSQKGNKKNFLVNLKHAGYGAENLLPTLTQCVASKNEILYFEEPERRAHPQLQADLGSLFIDSTSNENNNQIIIETHSENLLLGILKGVREKKIEPEKIKVVYVYLENGKSNIQQIDIDSEGRFKQVWRDGFFTERLNLV